MRYACFLLQQASGPQHQVAITSTGRISKFTVDSEAKRLRRRDGDFIGHIGKRHQRFQQMIAIGPLARNMQI